MKAKVKAAVFIGKGKPFEIREFPVPEVGYGAIIAKVRMSTICGSDLHTWKGKRKMAGPVILGHEILGEIKELGRGIKTDVMGKPLNVGDRITWTIMVNCGRCYYCCIKQIPQKCINLYKYGHETCTDPPHLNGGLAEYIYIKEGTGVFKVPDELSDEEVTPINCALATMVNGLETIGMGINENVVIQGAGLLGIYTISLLKELGAGKIISIDINDYRLKIAEEFGADYVINSSDYSSDKIIREIKNLTNGYGVDLAIEVSGNPAVIPQGVGMLCMGGRYLIAGSVFPEANFTLDGNIITTKMVTIKGIHNYNTGHLGEALRFMVRVHKKYPFQKIIEYKFSLNEIEEAFNISARQKALRVAVIP
jgi:putative phosphonate catabolism associated alcohol dehydrogenase